MKILVTGVNGQLGYDVVKEFCSRNIDCIGVDVADFDITDCVQTDKFIRNYAPDAVIHCAAYTAVDKAEDDVELCIRVNVLGSENIAKVCADIGAKLMYVSTDYVYGGEGDEPFEPTDAVNPKNVYGRTKLDGENAVRKLVSKHFVVRTSWVFGINGNNFVKTMLRLGAERDSLNVVCDQIGSPTYTPDLARAMCDLIVGENYGIYNASNEGYCSWAEFAEEIMLNGGCKTKINPIPSSEYPAKAERPLNSRLSKACLDSAGVARLPHWQDALNRYIIEIKERES